MRKLGMFLMSVDVSSVSCSQKSAALIGKPYGINLVCLPLVLVVDYRHVVTVVCVYTGVLVRARVLQYIHTEYYPIKKCTS